MSISTANQVAEFIIYFSHRHGDYITNLKLQKLLYYAQGWYLALYDDTLFDDEIQAWVHGPVVPSVYRKYKQYRWEPIPCKITKGQIPLKIEKHLIEVIKVYGDLPAYDLERMTHVESPWLNARKNLSKDVLSNAPISISDLKEYFSELSKQD